MTLLNKITSYSFMLAMFLFSLPLAFPNNEASIILIQFSFVFPLFLLLSFFKTDLFGIFLISIFFILIILLPLGMPGSFIGWMAMVCSGYLFGYKASKEGLDALYNLRYFALISIILSLWLVIKNYQNSFSYELLSDYFEVSSINTVPLLIVSIANIFSAFYYYMVYFQKNININNRKFLKTLTHILLALSSILVLVFEFRSGLGIFILILLVAWKSLGNNIIQLIFRYIITLLVIAYILYFGSILYELLTAIVTPGRNNILLVFKELTYGYRYEKMVNFWNVAALSKLDFHTWSSSLSVSGMSDLFAGLFPLSILFFIPSLYVFKFFQHLFSKKRIEALIVLLSGFSSFMISFIQPDFISMFSFFAISSLIYFGNKNNKNVI